MDRFDAYKGWFLVAVLCAIPVFLWARIMPLNFRMESGYLVFSSLGQLFGLVGLTIFSIVLVLSTRGAFLERWFGGLNEVYKAHHLLGAVSFMLLLFHPLLLAGRYAITSLSSAALFLLPSSNLPVDYGLIGLVLMIVFLVLTFYARLRYHIWKFTHKFMGVAFAFGVIHLYLIPSDVSIDLALRAYMLGITAAGIAAYCYWTLLGNALVKRVAYTVKAVRKLGQSVTEIEMAPAEAPIKFVPGQFIFVSFRQKGVSAERHPFSITSSPNEARLRISVKSLGDYTSKLGDLTPDAVAEVEGPYGRFISEGGSYRQVWIAGGIGITPFLSMARSLEESKGDGRSIDLYYCVKTADEAVFADELNSIARRRKNFRPILVCADAQGRLDASKVSKSSGDLAGSDIFICGPPPMMAGMKSQFIAMGLEQSQLHTEEFGLS